MAQAHSRDTATEAFRDFREAHQVPAKKRSHWWAAAVVAAAACLTALWIIDTRLNATPDTLAHTNIIHQAEPTLTGITITQDGNTTSIAQLAQQATGEASTVSMRHDTIVCRPMDLSRYKISSSTITIPQGQTAMLVLPDGSKVWLNAQSSLIYPTNFAKGKPRQVELKGEAFFEVVRDESRPFIVSCGKMHTTVLGTAFNVRNYPESAPQVTLASGAVRVTAGGRNTLLRPNQSATMAAGILHVADADVERVTCWRDGQFYFDGQTLHETLVEIGRWYNLDVAIKNDAHLNDRLHFRGERSWGVKEIVESLSVICDVQLSVEGSTLLLN